MLYGIILAAGKGTRMNSHALNKNKNSLLFNGRTLIEYGANLFNKVASKTFVVVGAYADSIKEALSEMSIGYIEQTEQLGTGHALKIAAEAISELEELPLEVIVGYGDHLMFYKEQTIIDLVRAHEQKKATISLITTYYANPEELKWGHIIRDKNNLVENVIEHKDASPKQRLITEVNPGFYCFNYQFIIENKDKLKVSEVTGEYYINDFIRIAEDQGKKIIPFPVPFSEVGIGINTPDELDKSQKLYKDINDR